VASHSRQASTSWRDCKNWRKRYRARRAYETDTIDIDDWFIGRLSINKYKKRMNAIYRKSNQKCNKKIW
jgi:hypothetical protein